MNPAKRSRQSLRRRLITAQYTILRRLNWPTGTARKMAREHADQLCSKISKKEKESQS